jgi:hypothetical protein
MYNNVTYKHNMLFDDLHFEHIIPLGHNCEIANALIDVSARRASYPFDWTLTHIDYIHECFTTQFHNFFAKELLTNSRKSTKNGGKYKELITFVHAGRYKDLMADPELYTSQKNKFQKRIERLYAILNAQTTILFVIDNFFATFENLSKLIRLLKKSRRFKAIIKMLIFGGGKEKIIELNQPQSQLNDFCFVSDQSPNRWGLGSFIRENINYKTYAGLSKSKKTYDD